MSVPASPEPTLEASQVEKTSTQANPAPRKKSPPRAAFEEFQVPAGNTLPIELRSRVSSATSQPSDPVEGRLVRALERDGVELVPAGAVVLGTIKEAEAAGPKKPGRLAFSFHVIEHPDTGSRAMIKAAIVRYESQPPVKGKTFSDVVLDKGTDASVLLLAPLLVRLPVE